MAVWVGKVPGVNTSSIQNTGRRPQSYYPRYGFFGDTSPLCVVDGMFYDDINFPEQL